MMKQRIFPTLVFLIIAMATPLSSEEPLPATVGNGVYEFTASDSYNFVWYRITKNGSRTMVALLQKYMGNQVDQDPEGNFRNVYDAEKYKDHFKFIFVRNPWERIVSCYFNKVYGKWFPPFKECRWFSFERWVEWIARQDLDKANIHIQRQTTFIPPEVELDFIGRVENYEKDICTLMCHFGIDAPAVPRVNVSEHEHYSHYYNEHTREIVRRLYEEDIVRFGYEFEEG